MIYLLPDKTDITHGQFSWEGINYPSNWVQLATIDDLSTIGVIILEEIYPTLAEGEYYDGTYTDDFIALTRTYNTLI